MKATIKIGDSFAVPIQFYDTKTNLGMMLNDDMKISATIINSSQHVIAKPVVTLLEQAGMILLEVPVSITKDWKIGTAQLDIKLEINDRVRHSENIQFQILRSITA
ncbi:hypothetical protein AMD27_13215 [Acinetobacter sp. TGL-Y2]|uniref:hypothetical protein n=1 Tax=Acinetobacter sp. TGL-Y2 TaxID=1407071 RepID=UPI0007A67677|nr:hypothetical protein [Acinetobacter sp. TGL-Y2]AMW79761.1 hypothetical protein AMD27_13215 [Acinetobacter sp. TGL-Y2]